LVGVSPAKDNDQLDQSPSSQENGHGDEHKQEAEDETDEEPQLSEEPRYTTPPRNPPKDF